MTHLEIIRYLSEESDNMQLAQAYRKMTMTEYVDGNWATAYIMFLGDPNAEKLTFTEFVKVTESSALYQEMTA